MDRELEIAAAASVGGLSKWRARHGAKVGSLCANCGAVLQGPYCHACGQLAENFNRSIFPLVEEAFENMFDADGRLVHTVPRLILWPATFTRDYIAGRRAAQTPPLRLFLVVILLFFFAGGLGDLGQNKTVWFKRDSAAETVPKLNFEDGPGVQRFAAWLDPRLAYAVSHQREFGAAVAEWLHRIAILMLPMATLILGLIFIFRRRFFLFDRAIFSMHSLSFMGLLFSATAIVGTAGPLGGVAGALGWLAPAHLFFHMRGVYGTSIIGTLLRMFVLFILSSLAVAILFVGVVALGLNSIGTPSA